MISLTHKGRSEVRFFIKECESKRKEIVDAKLDIVGDIKLPTEEDICTDIETFEENNEYINCWAITMEYDSEPLHLIKNEDYIDKPTWIEKVNELFNSEWFSDSDIMDIIDEYPEAPTDGIWDYVAENHVPPCCKGCAYVQCFCDAHPCTSCSRVWSLTDKYKLRERNYSW